MDRGTGNLEPESVPLIYLDAGRRSEQTAPIRLALCPWAPLVRDIKNETKQRANVRTAGWMCSLVQTVSALVSDGTAAAFA